jgi:conjugative relaxase-like TrwC/TraI family protein
VLSIGAMSGGQGEYYISLGREDYYTEGGEPPGRWVGEGASRLKLGSEVKADPFRSLLAGYSPHGKPLIQNAGEGDHQPGWDLTFSAPKSVSVIWSQADSYTRKVIQDAHAEAVKKALGYLEDAAAFTRRGKGGREVERASLIVAAFEHGTSRAQDPQLHTHAIVLNVGVREDGTTGTILSKPLYQSKMTAGAVYRAELAHQLEVKLGLTAERTGRVFEIRGVPKALIEEFSKRREAILAELERLGFSGAKAAAVAALATRSVKGHVAREELFTEWHLIGMERGFSLLEVRALLAGQKVSRDIEQEKREAVKAAVIAITDKESHFSERDLVRMTAEEGQGRGLGADAVRSAVRETLTLTNDIIALGRVNGELRYTTREMLEIEGRLLSAVEASRTKQFRLTEDVLIKASLSDEQKHALFYITETDGGVKVVAGMAGTGKTTLLAAAREVWEASGYRVIGASLSGKAAQGLEDGAGIKSDTIHRTLSELDKGMLTITPKTILVIDEAGMVGTRQMERLVSATQEAGGKLVLVGDAKQLQPIDAGGPFKAIAERIGAAELTDIRRQRDERDREAVKEIAGGRAENALRSYAERGLLTVEDDRRGAMEKLLYDWRREVGKKPEEALIITGTRLEAATINKLAQEERKIAGELGQRSIRVDGTRFFENDRILFTKNSRLYGVKNGSLGTVERIDELSDTITAKLDSGRRVTVSLSHYQDIRLGYAITTHKGQGVTVEKSFVLAGGEMQDRELSYVQASRSRGETRIYTDRSNAGGLVISLAQQMNKSRQKELATEVGKHAEQNLILERQF